MARKGSTTQRGYGHIHQTRRKQWEPLVRAGQVDCRRCGKPIPPDADWDLGHHDLDRSLPTSPEHRACNRATKGRHQKPCALGWFDTPAATAEPVDTSWPW